MKAMHLAAAVAGIRIIQTFTYSAKTYLQAGTLQEILSDWRPVSVSVSRASSKTGI